MKQHFLIREYLSDACVPRAACAHYFHVTDNCLTENTSEVTCGLCKLTHAFKEEERRTNQPHPEFISLDEAMSNVIRLFPNKPVDAIVEVLLENHNQGRIKSLSVAYTLADSSEGACETHVETVGDATSMIGMLEYNKTAVIEILKRYMET